MSDIRTVETVNIDDYRVRVAEQEIEDERYDAAVVGVKRDAVGQAFGAVFGNDSDYYSVDDAPIMDSNRKYVAVGKAVEAYLNQQAEGSDD